MTILIDVDELNEALKGIPMPHAVAEAIRNAKRVEPMFTYEEVVAVYRDKLERTGSMDAALMKVSWVSYNRGLTDAIKP